jgi:transposase InsO family protein
VATWKGTAYAAFVIGVFSRMIVGRRAATSMSAELTLDAPEQALWARQVRGNLIHHSDREPWRGLDEVEFARHEWEHGLNTKRLPEPVGYISPSE